MSDNLGKDVVVNWNFHEIEANKTFWTDSNCLEMQERILNYRPTFNLDTPMNVSSNYFPVDSAIAIRDHDENKSIKLQATIMNERS